MKKNLKLMLLAITTFVFVACGGGDDDGVNINEGSDNKTDVAVTGAVYSKGLTHAAVYGYVNLDKLPTSVTKKRMGIEIWYDDSRDPTKKETNELTNTNRLDVSFNSLSPGTTYTYRTYVEAYNGTTYYGEKKTFTTNDNFKNVVTTYDVKDVNQFSATISYTVDINRFPEDKVDANYAYVYLAYSYHSDNLTEANLKNASTRNIGYYSTFENLRDDQSKLECSISGEPDSTVYYVFFTKIAGKTSIGPVKHFTFQHLDLSTSGSVDLGLSVKWAACNLGANLPWNLGDKYAWGETYPKSNFQSNNYQWYTYNGSGSSYWYNNYSATKYTIASGLTTLTADDDAATANLGSEWRMPTYSEQKELIDKCTWEKITLHGRQGYYIVGPNGKSIFLPSYSYWSSTLAPGYNDLCAYEMYGKQTGVYERYYGCFIRPVHK